MTKVYY